MSDIRKRLRRQINGKADIDEIVGADEALATIERLTKALDQIVGIASWHHDEDASFDDPSPDDAVAHANGLVVRVAREALKGGGA